MDFVCDCLEYLAVVWSLLSFDNSMDHSTIVGEYNDGGAHQE